MVTNTPRVRFTVDDLTSRYGRRTVLRGVSLDLDSGEHGKVVGLLGPNAAGKSTLIKTLAGVKKPAAGHLGLTVADTTIRGQSLRRAIGYVPQDLPSSAALTAFETVVISARGASSWSVSDQVLHRAEAALVRLGIEHVAHRSVAELSGGQRQLVAVAQALAREPEVLLLDEPTSALDLRHQISLLTEVRSVVAERDCLAIVAIHDLNLATRYCDELVVMTGGQVVATGEPADIVDEELLRAVYQVDATVLTHDGVPVVSPHVSGG